jgi:hypothetical protein
MYKIRFRVCLLRINYLGKAVKLFYLLISEDKVKQFYF